MIYDNVKKYADMNGMAITAVETAAGLGRGSIGKWKNTNNVQMESLMKVATVLGVTVPDLIAEVPYAVPKA